jgi:hypothetical protein
MQWFSDTGRDAFLGRNPTTEYGRRTFLGRMSGVWGAEAPLHDARRVHRAQLSLRDDVLYRSGDAVGRRGAE